MHVRKNVAARAAQWSSNHRKLAIWGWLAIVVVLVGGILGAGLIERKEVSTVDTFSGESQQAERALTDAGLRPTEEVLLIQSDPVGGERMATVGGVSRTAWFAESERSNVASSCLPS